MTSALSGKFDETTAIVKDVLKVEAETLLRLSH